MKSKIDNRFNKLCVKAVTGNITEDEQRLLNNWLSESAENKNEFERIQAIWIKSDLKDFPTLPDTAEEWNELDARIRNYGSKEKIKTAEHKKLESGITFLSGFKFKPVLSAALVIIFFISIMLLWNLEMGKPDLKLIATENKQHKEINLSDGSHLLLNSGSTVQFPESFDEKERKISLKGEAFFSVAKDKRPFIILTDNAAVTVLGTKFNVRSRDGKTQVYVKDGKVNLAQQNLNEAGVVLSKGELSSVIKNGVPAPPVAADPDPQLGWIEGKLVFNHTPLPEIVEEIERFYDVEIFLQGNRLESHSLTGSFKSSKIDNVLGMICLALDLDYSRQPASDKQSLNEKEQYIIKHKNF